MECAHVPHVTAPSTMSGGPVQHACLTACGTCNVDTIHLIGIALLCGHIWCSLLPLLILSSFSVLALYGVYFV